VTRDSFVEALRATARIACVATIVGAPGCRAEPPQTASNDPQAPPPVSPPESEPTAPRVTVDPGALPTDGSKPSFEALRACESKVATVFSTSNAEPTPETKLCCDALANEALDTGGSEAWMNLRPRCCELLEWATIGCTPWGPPTPPSMPGTRTVLA
jgi:hypothetical protein